MYENPYPHPASLPPTHSVFKIQIRFLGDPSGQFTKDLDLSFDSAAVFGQDRSKRYALVVEDGKVKSAHVEPDNTGVNGKRVKEAERCQIIDRLLTLLSQSPLPRKFSAASEHSIFHYIDVRRIRTALESIIPQGPI